MLAVRFAVYLAVLPRPCTAPASLFFRSIVFISSCFSAFLCVVFPLLFFARRLRWTCRARGRWATSPYVIVGKSGTMFRVGAFSDSVSLPARTMHPDGAYVRGTKRNRLNRRQPFDLSAITPLLHGSCRCDRTSRFASATSWTPRKLARVC